MSERRTARRSAAAPPAAVEAFSDDLAMGPCMEVWAKPGQSTYWSVRRRWHDAVLAWVVETGWASERRPALNAMNLGRTRHPWSRKFLLERR